MRTAKTYEECPKHIYHPEIRHCLTCQQRLKRFATLSQRTIITLGGPIRIVHQGYRCSNPACTGRQQVYRSAVADAIALPGFTFGMDVLILVGQLKLQKHQTLDEVYETVNGRLKPFQLSISRRNIMYLFDAYCTLLTAAHQNPEDESYQQWLSQVREQGGIILSIDGIQPDKGNETIYLVRDVLTGRVLNAQNVVNSDTETIKKVLSPIKALPISVLGAISDAQVSLREAIAALWPDIPHQTCQFHYLQEAARPIFEQDRAMHTQMRKQLSTGLRPLRAQLSHALSGLQQSEAVGTTMAREQLNVLSEYTVAAQSALQLDGRLPFDYAGLKGIEALDELATSLDRLEKKGEKREP